MCNWASRFSVVHIKKFAKPEALREVGQWATSCAVHFLTAVKRDTWPAADYQLPEKAVTAPYQM